MKRRDDALNNVREEETSDNSFFCEEGVKVCKNIALKNRLRALISSKGLSEAEFYNSLGFTKQYWYETSWGIFPTPLNVKIKISNALKVDSRSIYPTGEKEE